MASPRRSQRSRAWRARPRTSWRRRRAPSRSWPSCSGLVPFVCAQLTCWDPVEQRHSTLRATATPIRCSSTSRARASRASSTQLDMLRTRRPMRMRDLPGDPGDVLTVSEVLLPAGFREGLTMCLVHAQRASSRASSTSRPTTAATRATARATPSPRSTRRSPTSSTSRRPAARSHRCSIRARRRWRWPPTARRSSSPAATAAPALAEGSPLLEVLAGQVPRDGHERRFLWPDGESGWYRVRIVPCLDEAGGRSLALVTVRPCDHVLGLTRREIEVLTHLAGGASNPAIARVLHVSPRTVATHVEHILEKLDVSTRAAAAGRAVREALVLPLPRGQPREIRVRDQGVAPMRRGARRRHRHCMAAYPHASPSPALAHAPGRPPRARGERPRRGRGPAGTPRRPRAAPALRRRLGLDRGLARAQPRLGRRQGDRLEGGARRAARPAPRALRARRAGALHRLPAQHRAVRPHGRGGARRGARAAAAADRSAASRRARSPAPRSPSSSCSASRWRSASSRSRRCCTCRTWSGSSRSSSSRVLSVVSVALMIVMRKARGRLAGDRRRASRRVRRCSASRARPRSR